MERGRRKACQEGSPKSSPTEGGQEAAEVTPSLGHCGRATAGPQNGQLIRGNSQSRLPTGALPCLSIMLWAPELWQEGEGFGNSNPPVPSGGARELTPGKTTAGTPDL